MTPAMPWERVLARAAAVTGASVGGICGPSRRRDICRVRWAVVCALRGTGLSFSRIGRRLGNRDHSTMMHAEREGRALMARDAAFRVLVEDLGHAARGQGSQALAPVCWVPPAVTPSFRERSIAEFDVDEREEIERRRAMARGSVALAAAIGALRFDPSTTLRAVPLPETSSGRI